MICEVCGYETSIRLFFPIKNSLRRFLNTPIQNLQQGKWVCPNCAKKLKTEYGLK